MIYIFLIPPPQKKRIIKNGEMEYIQLWQKNCLKFIALLKENYPVDHIILVKNHLMEYWGEYGKEHRFSDQSKIKNCNKMLKGFYDFFEKNYPGIHAVNIDNNEILYSDSHHTYGCEPFHYNIQYEQYVANEILSCLNSRK